MFYYKNQFFDKVEDIINMQPHHSAVDESFNINIQLCRMDYSTNITKWIPVEHYVTITKEILKQWQGSLL